MSKLIAVLVASMFATAAFAQNIPGTPPTVPAAGTGSTKMEMKKDDMMKKDDAMSTTASDKKAARKARSAARKTKRAAKVDDKPVN